MAATDAIRCATLILGGMPCPKTVATDYYVQLGLPDKGLSIQEYLDRKGEILLSLVILGCWT